MNKLQRATIGQIVQADVTGTGNWDFGAITEFNDKHITFTSHTDGMAVKMLRSEVYKADADQVALTKLGHNAAAAKEKIMEQSVKQDPMNEKVTPEEIAEMQIQRGVRKNLVPVEYREAYFANKAGKKFAHNGDRVANELDGRELAEVYEHVAVTMSLEVADLQSKYKHLNAGMQRMNLGNKLRGHYNKQEQAE